MNYLFPPGSSQDGEGEADESMEDVDVSTDLALDPVLTNGAIHSQPEPGLEFEIGRASCRERV